MLTTIKALVISFLFGSSLSLVTLANAHQVTPANWHCHFIVGADGHLHWVCD